MFTAVIIDDEPLASEAMRGLCVRSGQVRVLGEGRDGHDGLDLISRTTPDVAFLDIGMPDLSGIDVARRLTAFARPPLIVFATAYDHFATQAFDLAVVDYLLKPIDADRFRQCITRLRRRLDERRLADDAHPAPDFWLPWQGGVTRVSASSIHEVRAERDYVRIVTDQRSFLMLGRISEMAARLDPRQFVRVHRSTILRTSEIVRLEQRGGGRWSAVDRADRSTSIGQSYLAEVRAQLGVNPLAGDRPS